MMLLKMSSTSSTSSCPPSSCDCSHPMMLLILVYQFTCYLNTLQYLLSGFSTHQLVSPCVPNNNCWVITIFRFEVTNTGGVELVVEIWVEYSSCNVLFPHPFQVCVQFYQHLEFCCRRGWRSPFNGPYPLNREFSLCTIATQTGSIHAQHLSII